jgi:Family of unknown function (DUF6111)
MIRLAELALFFAPLAAYLLWRLTVRRGLPGPTRQTLVVILAGLLLLGAGLAWTGIRERHPAGSHYVPAQLRDGRIVPGHGA